MSSRSRPRDARAVPIAAAAADGRQALLIIACPAPNARSDELRELLAQWEQGEVRISVPVRRIEELIDMEVLESDVLLVHGDYEHYRYDFHD